MKFKKKKKNSVTISRNLDNSEKYVTKGFEKLPLHNYLHTQTKVQISRPPNLENKGPLSIYVYCFQHNFPKNRLSNREKHMKKEIPYSLFKRLQLSRIIKVNYGKSLIAITFTFKLKI